MSFDEVGDRLCLRFLIAMTAVGLVSCRVLQDSQPQAAAAFGEQNSVIVTAERPTLHCTLEPVEGPGLFSEGCYVDEQYSWVSGLAASSGNPRVTSDGGRTWKEVRPSAESGIQAWSQSLHLRATFANRMLGWITGDHNTWQTSDGGLTWRRLFDQTADDPQFTDSHYTWLNVALDGSSQRSYASRDGGSTWQACGAVRRYDWHVPGRHAYFLNTDLGWSVTSISLERNTTEGVARTTDGGCTWEQLWVGDDSPDETYSDIYFLNDKDGWLAGGYVGSLRCTTDGGRFWKELMIPARHMKLRSVYFDDARRGWVIDKNAPREQSGIYHTSDAGQTWRQLTANEIMAGFDGKEGENLIPVNWKEGRFRQMVFSRRVERVTQMR